MESTQNMKSWGFLRRVLGHWGFVILEIIRMCLVQIITDVHAWGPMQDRWGSQPGPTKSTYKTFAYWTHNVAPSPHRPVPPDCGPSSGQP